MPYMWVEPEIFLKYKDVDVYYIFKDDCIDNPTREFWYGFYSTCADEIDEGSFDIRDAQRLLPPETLTACAGDHKVILMALIDGGFLEECGFMIDGYLCDNACSIQEAVDTVVARRQTAA